MKISQYPSDAAPIDNDSLILVDSTTGLTKKATRGNVLTGNPQVSGTYQDPTLTTASDSRSYLTQQLLNDNLYNNCVVNSDFTVWQEGATRTTPNNNVYIADLFVNLQAANGAWTFTQDNSTLPGNGARYSCKCVNVTLNKQVGLLYILENKDTIPFAGRSVSLNFQAAGISANSISNLRATLLSWTGTADAPTRSAVSAWAGAGTDPTFAASWTKNVAGSNLAVTAATWNTYKIENVAIPSNTTNLAIFIWVDDTTIAAGKGFYITSINLNLGTKSQLWMPTAYGDELRRCERYYIDLSTTTAMAYRIYHNNVHRFGITFPVTMRVAPTLTHTFSATGLAADNSAAWANYGIQFDTQFTAGGTGVVDATVTALKADARM